MRRATVALLLVLALPGFAKAACYPPPGLAAQDWYAMCESTLQQLYAGGAAPGMPYQAFVGRMYHAYGQASQAPAAPSYGCSPGATMCVSGWLRTCQSFSYGTQWITGAQRC